MLTIEERVALVEERIARLESMSTPPPGTNRVEIHIEGGLGEDEVRRLVRESGMQIVEEYQQNQGRGGVAETTRRYKTLS